MKIKTMIMAAATLAMCACGTSKKVADTATVDTTNTTTASNATTATNTTDTGKPATENTVPANVFPAGITHSVSDIDLSIAIGDDSYDLGGKLWMKRDQVVRLNLTFMGFIEVGTIEFAPDNILIINRIGKEYTRMPYNASDVLVKNNITFSNIEQMAWQKFYVADGKKKNDVGLDKALEDMLSSNLKGGKKVKIHLQVGKPDTKREFEPYTTVKSSYTEVPAQLLITRLMSFAK